MQGLRRWTLPSVLTAELLGVAAGCLAATFASPVIAVTFGVLVAVVFVLPIRRQSLLGRLSTVIGYARSSNLDLPVPTDERTGLGVSWSGLECAAVVSIVPKTRLTILSRRGAVPGEQLLVADLAVALHQHDITLAGIDIVSHSRRIQTRPASVLRQLIGPLPAVPDRTVWIVVRLNARSAAVERRGGGREGAVSTLKTATSRIVDVLARHDIGARIMSSAEITAVSEAVASGDAHNGWSSVTIGDHTDSGFSATELTSTLVDSVWTIPAQATTTMLALRPHEVAGRVTASMSWRLTGADKTPALPARRVDGHQLQHLRTHLPLASNVDGALVFHDVSVDDLSRFALATGGCGQLIGATSDGRAVAIPLCAPSTRTATLVGSSMFLRQTIFRGVATGARIAVRTDRPDMWEPLVEAVGNGSHLRVIALGEQMPAGYDVLVADGDLQEGSPGTTTVFAASTPAAFDGIEPDVSITATGASITVTAGGQSIMVDLVTVPAEQQFIGGSSGVRIS